MVLSEAEAEAQLASLRRQREALDRSITDLTLYLELGRRLTAEPWSRSGEQPRPAGAAQDHGSQAVGSDDVPARRGSAASPPVNGSGDGVAGFVPQAEPTSAAASTHATSSLRRESETASGTLRPNASDGVLSEGVLARRYGRALIEAALAVLRESGRPLHASEILAALTHQGFSLPGHDPVAALNTRLWKRSGSGGPLIRMGDAVYALTEPPEA